VVGNDAPAQEIFAGDTNSKILFRADSVTYEFTQEITEIRLLI